MNVKVVCMDRVAAEEKEIEFPEGTTVEQALKAADFHAEDYWFFIKGTGAFPSAVLQTRDELTLAYALMGG